MERELEDRTKAGILPLALALPSSLEKGKGHAVRSIWHSGPVWSGFGWVLEHTVHALLLPVEAIGVGSQFCQPVVGCDNQGCGGVSLPHASGRDGIILIKGIQKPIEYSRICFGLYHLQRQDANMFGFLLVTQGGVSAVL